jgi:coproporphyrinogen III oxidase
MFTEFWIIEEFAAYEGGSSLTPYFDETAAEAAFEATRTNKRRCKMVEDFYQPSIVKTWCDGHSGVRLHHFTRP